MRSTIRAGSRYAIAVAAALCIGLPALAAAATETTPDASAATAAQNPAEELLELDEIWVHGKNLARRIADAENAFFYRYNKLNRKADYRITCGYFTLDRGSMVMRRNCTPAFLDANLMPGTSSGSAIRRINSCYNGAATMSFGSNEVFSGENPCSIRGIISSRVYQLDSTPAVRTVPVSPEVRKAYATHVMKLMITDNELRAKAEDLAVLYREFDQAQLQYVKAKETAVPRRHGHPRY